MLLKVLDADGAAKRVKGGWVGTGAEWVYDRERHRRIAEARVAEQKAMLEYLDTAECRMVFLRRQLDDPTAAVCGRCDVCTGTVWSPEVAASDTEAARERLSRPGVEVAPRRQWPSGMAGLAVPVSGRIPADEQAEPGRVIGRLSDIGWGAQLRELLESADGPAPTAQDADQPVPKDVLDACMRVLAGWGWAERPVGVVGMGSRTRPHQLAHLARRIAEIGRLPLLGTLAPHGPRPDAHANSAQRLAAVWHTVAEPRVRPAGRPGAARRRRDRHRLDDDGRRAPPATGGCGCGAAVGAGRGWMIRTRAPRRCPCLASACEEILQHPAVVVAAPPRQAPPMA